MKKTHEDRIFPLIRCDTVKPPPRRPPQSICYVTSIMGFEQLRPVQLTQISGFSSGSALDLMIFIWVSSLRSQRLQLPRSSSGWLQLSRSSSPGWLQLSRSSSAGWLQLSRSSSTGWLQLSRSSSTGSVTSVGFKCHGRREASNVTLLPHSGYKFSTIYLCRH